MTDFFVSPDQFGADPTGLQPADSAVQDCWDSAKAVIINGTYKLTRTHIIPQGTHIDTINPAVNGFLADMSSGISLDLSAGNIIAPNLAVRSSDFPAISINDSPEWTNGERSIKLGSNCHLGNVYLDNLCRGLEHYDVNNVSVDYLNARNIRSREGWASAWHVKRSTNIRLGHIDAQDCDRACEPEFDSHDIHVGSFLLDSIYPNGYEGQSENYAGYSFVVSAHSHIGEGACTNVFYGNGTIRNCVGSINFWSDKNADSIDDYCSNIGIGNVVIESPRFGQTPVALSGRDIEIQSINFKKIDARFTHLIQFGVENGTVHARRQSIKKMISDGSHTFASVWIYAPESFISC